MNTLPCDMARCSGSKCDLKQYCARYTAPTRGCAMISHMEASYCIKNNNIEYISNGKLDALKKS